MGVNVVGHIGGRTGLGAIARLVVQAVEAAGITCTAVDIDAPQRSGPLHATTIACVNPDSLVRLAQGPARATLIGRRTIGFWWWEVERVPPHWRWSAKLFDEIWAGSTYVRDALARVVECPVRTFPVPILAPEFAKGSPPRHERHDFTFLFAFDFESVYVRKNPHGLIEAFGRALGGSRGVSLVVKSSNAARHPAERADLAQAARRFPNVSLIEDSLSPASYNALVSACDAYISLHRAEGFGLTLAEAMALGKPVIATAYSGNLEFMTQENSLLVPWSRVPIPAGLPYPAGTTWAEPDLVVAGEMMRDVLADPGDARGRAAAAREEILGRHSLARASEFLAEHCRAAPRAGRSEDPFRVVVERLLLGPDLSSNRRLLRIARRLAKPLFRPYLDHQAEVIQFLLEAMSPRRSSEEDKPGLVRDS